MNTHCYDLAIRVLVFKEDGDFVAHGLEVDLVAYGSTEKEVMMELGEMLRSQISFASQNNSPQLVEYRAPQEFFDRWDKANQCALKGAVSDDFPATMRAGDLHYNHPTGDSIRKEASF